MKTWISPDWTAVLQRHHLDEMGVLWDMELDLAEKPNRERGGYSEVGRLVPDGESFSLYVKRQQNYTYRPLVFPLVRRLLCAREFENLQWCVSNNIPVPQPVAFMQRRQGSNLQAILVTAGLDEYVPLSDAAIRGLSRPVRDQLIIQTASLVRRLHDAGMIHGCLYPKHVYLHKDWLQTGAGELRLIDLERARRISWSNGSVFRDLDTMNRRAAGDWSYRERMLFLQQYLGDRKGQIPYWVGRLSSSYQSMIAKDA